MDIHFNSNIATKYGVNCAILLQNIYFWIEENRKSNRNFQKGRFWTYNSIKAFTEQFPFMTQGQIRSALKLMKDEELILTANFNSSCDRTLWYTITEKALNIMNNVLVDENQEDFLNQDEEYIIERNSNSSESRSEVLKIQDDVLPEAKPFAVENKTICCTEQIDLLQGTNDTDNKPQIKNSDNQEKEIYKEKETPAEQIFNFWNSKNLLRSTELNKYLETVITTVLKSFTLEQVKLYISRYAKVLSSNFYFNHTWSLKSFLSNHNAMKEFQDDGEKWVNYLKWEYGLTKRGKDFIHNNYTEEQINSLYSNLDEVQV